MDKKVEKYRQIIIALLKEYANTPVLSLPNVEVEDQLMLDTERDHYQIVTVGWENGARVYYPIFHLDIKKDKIWIQEDASDTDLVDELENRGVAKNDIVLAFHSPTNRPYTGFAVA
jgi:XisI protein